jgi:hypothetical protein
LLESVAFMVMPFNEKATDRSDAGIPAKVDFDALWANVHKPVLEELGYTAVRADCDVGSLIVQQMIQRLTIADLVLADITLANANVYYEIGVRHAAKATGCVLVSADWARPVFDLAQMRQLRFPLGDGTVSDSSAEAARSALRAGLRPLVHGRSPVFDAVPGFPDTVQLNRVSAFEAVVIELSQFDAAVAAVRAAPSVAAREAKVKALVKSHGMSLVVREAVVLELIRLLRDHVGWEAVLAYIDGLPPHVANQTLVLEQHALAISEAGQPDEAVGRLKALIAAHGESSERLGLLGGRYKRLADMAEKRGDSQDARYLLNQAIESYERGMLLDPSDYYPSVNLMQLCRRRGDPGDAQLASDAEAVTTVACRAAVELGHADRWARPTLLNLAFSRGDVAEAMKLRLEVEREGPAIWELKTTVADLRRSAGAHTDETVRAGLEQVVVELEKSLPEGTV